MNNIKIQKDKVFWTLRTYLLFGFIGIIVIVGVSLLIYFLLQKKESDNNKEDVKTKLKLPSLSPSPSASLSPPLLPPQSNEEHEVFNTEKNIWTYDEAPHICKKLNSELATYDQLINSAHSGSNWCNMGWFKETTINNENNQKIIVNAGYPVQKKYYDKLKNIPKYKNKCGNNWNPNFKNEKYSIQHAIGKYPTHRKYGVNCYGKKRKISKNELDNKKNLDYLSLHEKTIMNDIKLKEQNISLTSYNKYNDKWSKF